MTTIQQQMQTGPAKANEIFAKLADTSPTAVKTRERLFSDLKGELDRQAEFEEQRLFPVLKKHDETNDLVAEALKNNQQMRKLLTELERSPKDSEAFGKKVTELRDLFQRHLRDHSNEFLPAVMKALSDDEAGTAAGKTEDEATGNTPARRAEDGHEEAGAARQSAEAGASFARQGARVARMATEANADAGRSMVALLNEQAQHVLQIQTVMAAGHAQRLAEVAQVQSAFMAASFRRMGQVNDRYLAYVRCWPGLRHHSVHPSLMV